MEANKWIQQGTTPGAKCNDTPDNSDSRVDSFPMLMYFQFSSAAY